MSKTMAANQAGKSKQQRRGPAPFASFEDVSDEVRTKASSPEAKVTTQLPGIEEDELRKSSIESTDNIEIRTTNQALSTPLTHVNSLQTPSTPRIDISRASSSSHHDSRDSSPEMALFMGKEKDAAKLELGFREEGTLDLRSSTEELTFLEPNTATAEKETPRPPSRRSPLMFKDERRHSRKDSQCSDIVLLSISGRTSRLSSIGSQGSGHSNISAHSNISHASMHSNVTHISAQSRLSVISGVSRSPSPHKMLLETSFCGPKPIESEPEVTINICNEKILDLTNVQNNVKQKESIEPVVVIKKIPEKINKTEVKTPPKTEIVTAEDEKFVANKKVPPNQLVANELKQENKPIESKPEIKPIEKKEAVIQEKPNEKKNLQAEKPRRKTSRSSNTGNKDIIRIRLKPDHMYDDDDNDDSIIANSTSSDVIQKPDSLNLHDHNKKPAPHFTQLVNRTESIKSVPEKPTGNMKAPSLTATPCASPTPSKKISRKDHSRTPSPTHNVSRKSSFCSLFKSRETILSPESPTRSALKKKGSHDDRTRPRSKSRDRSLTPTSASKIKGSVLSLFKQPKKSTNSLSPVSRDTSPVVHASTSKSIVYHQTPTIKPPEGADKLKYYENTQDGIIHIPLHTPPDEEKSSPKRNVKKIESKYTAPEKTEPIIITSKAPNKTVVQKPSENQKRVNQRTVLPDGSIIIPLHSPSDEITVADDIPEVKKNFKKPENKKTLISDIEPIVKNVVALKSSSSSEDPPLAVTQLVVTSVEEQRPKKEHIIFTTSVGSREQIFSTQFSLTKTPSLNSDSTDFASLQENLKEKPIVEKKELSVQTIESSLRPETLITSIERNVIMTASENSTMPAPVPQVTKSNSNDEIQPNSSESEISSEMEALKKNLLQEIMAEAQGAEESEKKGLVLTQDSFEDELPYVPTTLPQERSVALPIIPVKERQSTGMRMYPIERPRSTTPIHPSCLEEYCSDEPKTPDNIKVEKLKICLPKETTEKHKVASHKTKSPRRVSYSSSPKAWCEFAEKGLPNAANRKSQGSVNTETEKQPALPPRAPVPKSQWINFEDVPEKRKMPKRIQTIPRHTDEERDDCGIVYNYVNPEDCKCECHESARASLEKEEDEEPLLDDNTEQEGLSMPVVDTLQISAGGNRRSVISDSSLELSCGNQEIIDNQSSAHIGHPFNMDLGIRSNRSSIISQDGVLPAQDVSSPRGVE